MSAKSAPALYKGGILRYLRSEPMGDIYGGGMLKSFISALKNRLPKNLRSDPLENIRVGGILRFV